MVITFDGAAGAGKSSLARGLADNIGFNFCSAGAIYRAIAYKILSNNIGPLEYDKIRLLLENTDVYLIYKRGHFDVFLDGKDVTNEAYSKTISEFTPHVAKIPFLREFVRSIQYKMAENGNLIIEGRDTGSVVFKNADLKFFVVVSDELRAKRRMKEYLNKGENISFEECLKRVILRDKEDEEREASPLIKPDGAIVFENNYDTYEEALEALTKIVKQKLNLK